MWRVRHEKCFYPLFRPSRHLHNYCYSSLYLSPLVLRLKQLACDHHHMSIHLPIPHVKVHIQSSYLLAREGFKYSTHAKLRIKAVKGKTIDSMLCARLEPGSGSGIRNKAIVISAKQQSHTEEYVVVHGSSNKNTVYCTWSE